MEQETDENTTEFEDTDSEDRPTNSTSHDNIQTLDDSSSDEEARSTWQSLEQELTLNEIHCEPERLSQIFHKTQNVIFPLNMLSGRPHIHIHFADGISKMNTLLDSGSKFNILSINLLQQIEQNKGVKIQLQQPRIKLMSHTDDPLDIC